jgi:hypothetical protein
LAYRGRRRIRHRIEIKSALFLNVGGKNIATTYNERRFTKQPQKARKRLGKPNQSKSQRRQ